MEESPRILYFAQSISCGKPALKDSLDEDLRCEYCREGNTRARTYLDRRQGQRSSPLQDLCVSWDHRYRGATLFHPESPVGHPAETGRLLVGPNLRPAQQPAEEYP